MKTILLTAYEGMEARTIFRTAVLETLLQDPDLRLVVLMKNEERINLYKKEFSDPRIIYQVTPYPLEPVSWLDRFFSWMRFTLIRTETSNLHRELLLDANGNYISFIAGHVLNFCLARPWAVRIFRALDYALVKTNIFQRLFEEYRPSAVFLLHLFGNPEIHLLREARARGILTIGFSGSWDKVTTRGLIRLLPDLLLVPNQIIKDEVVRYDAMDASQIKVLGMPQFDMYVSGKASPREKFFQKVGIDPADKIIVYAAIGPRFGTADWVLIDLLHYWQREGKLGRGVAILVRFQPNDSVDMAEIKKRPFLHYDYPGIRFSELERFSMVSSRGIDWDMSFEDLQHLYDTIYYMSVIVCYVSTMILDAAMLDKPVINLGFELAVPAHSHQSPKVYLRKNHYRKAIASGGIRLVRNPDELAEWIGRYLADPGLDSSGRERLRREQSEFSDGKSGERIAKSILAVL